MNGKPLQAAITMMLLPGFFGLGVWAQARSICNPSTGGLVACWKLDDAGKESRTIADSLGKNPGRPVGELVVEPGRVGHGLLFDGLRSYVEVPNAGSLAVDSCGPKGAPCGLTLEAWIYTNSDAGIRPILDKRRAVAPPPPKPAQGATTPVKRREVRGYYFYIAYGSLAFQMADGAGASDYVSESLVGDGLWHHVAVTVDRRAGTGVLYTDGKPVLRFTPRAGSTANDAPLLLGRTTLPNPKVPAPPPEDEQVAGTIEPPAVTGADGFFQGVLDEVALYRRPLAEKEIANDFSNGAERSFQPPPRPLAGTFDVGVVPETAGNCPAGSEYVTIYMDDEDDHCASSLTGWVGATSERITSHVNGTTFGFCRVDGTQFHNLGHFNLINWSNVTQSPAKATVGAYTYSVLKLGSQCPPDAKEIVVHIDNEKTGNLNSSTGNIAPNSQSTHHTNLYFCEFSPKFGSSMADFPQLGVAYGVFGGRFLPPAGAGHHNFWLNRGQVHTDDEDKQNDSSNTYFAGYDANDDVFDFTAGVQVAPGGNSDFFLSLVKKPPCPNPCPTGGFFDGANCFMYAVPGNSPFIYNGAFYYARVDGHPSSPCPHAVWDMFHNTSIQPGFDTANCFIKSANGGPNPFLWTDAHGTHYYISRSCLTCANKCPFGGTFDGANCYMFTWPGVEPFIWQGNAYYKHVWHPNGACPHVAYNVINGTNVTPSDDGANCVVFLSPGNGQQAFLYANNYYLTPVCTP
jgi:hypothetical protein